jgi:hypothetical protein
MVAVMQWNVRPQSAAIAWLRVCVLEEGAGNGEVSRMNGSVGARPVRRPVEALEDVLRVEGD